MASIAPVCSPTAIICVTIPGKTADSFNGSVSDLPSSSDLRTWNSARSTTALPDVLAVISRPSRIGTPEEINVPSVRVNRATAILRIRMPRTGSLRIVASIAYRPPGVPYHTFSPKTPATMPTTISNPKILPTKLLNPMTIFVGNGRSTPNPANDVAKIGTTFQSSNVMTPAAIDKTPIG